MELGKGVKIVSELNNKDENNKEENKIEEKIGARSNKKKANVAGKIKDSFSGRKFRSGAYVTLLSSVVIVIILVANMLITKMNIQIDLSTSNLYTLSQDTKDFVKNLKDDITIYYLVQPGSETDTFVRIAQKYDDLSEYITLETKDPVQYPQFAAQYVEDEVTKDSFLVVNNTNNRAKYVDGSELLIQEPNYQTYTYETVGLDVEGKLTSAIQYVTSTDLPVMYVVEGHGETTTGTFFNDTMEKANMDVKTLSTLTQSTIPEDCDILFINSPTKDFSEEEVTMIKGYLAAGGKAVITLNYYANELKNFKSILGYYGIELVDGFVIEEDSDRYLSNYPAELLPKMESHDITAKASGSQVPVYMPYASGLTISDTKRSSLTIEPLLTTSDAAFSRVDQQSTSVDKIEGDIEGPFYLGLVATDTYNDLTSTLIVYSCASTFGDEAGNASNPELLSGTVNYLAGEDIEILSIPERSVVAEQIYPSQKQVYFWGIIVVLAIPALLLTTGIVVCLRRRRK